MTTGAVGRKVGGMKVEAAALVVILCATAAHAQTKCTAPDGSVSYQSAPCPAGARSDRVTVATAPASAPAEGSIEWALARRRLVEGMNRGHVRQVMMAAPDRVNTTVTAGVSREQQIYERREATYYVYLDDGIVVAVQKVER